MAQERPSLSRSAWVSQPAQVRRQVPRPRSRQSEPRITGPAAEGSLLVASNGSWASRSPITYSYQWRRCLADGTGCLDIPKATDDIYASGAADVGHTLRVVVTATNKDGSSAATSKASGAVLATPADAPHNAVAPTISGPLTPGQTVTAVFGTWTGRTPLSFAYRWRRCDANGGACRNTFVRTKTYKLSGNDAGHTLRVLVTATSAVGSAASLSDPSASIIAPGPQNTSAPTISGTPRQGQVLRGDPGRWANNPSGYTYSWLRCDATGSNCVTIGGAVGKTYTLTSTDIAKTIRFRVEAKNSRGSTVASSAPTAVIAAATTPPAGSPPQNSAPPTIAGTPQEGHQLNGARGNWSNDVSDYHYFWTRCDKNGNNCSKINGATSTSYMLASADVGHTLRFRVDARNGNGTTSARSVPTASITAAPQALPHNTSPPTVKGIPQEGQTLKGDRGNWTGNPSDYNDFWVRCDKTGGSCSNISGANNKNGYVLKSVDVGNTLRFKVQATNSAGSNFASSVPTAVVVSATKPPPPPPPVTNGCPAGTGAIQIADLSPPARLLLDQQQTSPSVVTRGTQQLIVRYHVTACKGRAVQGALVYATAVPFNQLTIPPEGSTNSDGWAELDFRMMAGFPVSGKQQLIAIFTRARKSGEDLLGGISTRRLFSVQVRLNG